MVRNAEVERHSDARRNSSERHNNERGWSDVSRNLHQCRVGDRLEDLYRQPDTSAHHLPGLELYQQANSENTTALTGREQFFGSRDAMRDSYRTTFDVTSQFNDPTERPMIALTADNRVREFTDIGGNHYVARGGNYFNDRNPAQSRGVELDATPDGGVRMRDRESGIVRTTSRDGVETTDYGAVGGGTATRRISHGQETIQFQDRGGRQRSLVLQTNENGAMVQSYTDGSGTTYTFNNQRNGDGGPLYTARRADGQELGSNFTVNADRSGNVIVNNNDNPNAADFARRELNNGITVTSNRDGSTREIRDAAGNVLDPNSDATRLALRTRMISDVPRDVHWEENLTLAASLRAGMDLPGGAVVAAWQLWGLFDGGRWDPKRAGEGNNVSNMEYEAFGNWQYGYLGRASGFSEEFLTEQAGRFQHNRRPEWGTPGFLGSGGTGNQGDDPADTRYIQRGYASYRGDHPQETNPTLEDLQLSFRQPAMVNPLM